MMIGDDDVETFIKALGTTLSTCISRKILRKVSRGTYIGYGGDGDRSEIPDSDTDNQFEPSLMGYQHDVDTAVGAVVKATIALRKGQVDDIKVPENPTVWGLDFTTIIRDFSIEVHTCL